MSSRIAAFDSSKTFVRASTTLLSSASFVDSDISMHCSLLRCAWVRVGEWWDVASGSRTDTLTLGEDSESFDACGCSVSFIVVRVAPLTSVSVASLGPAVLMWADTLPKLTSSGDWSVLWKLGTFDCKVSMIFCRVGWLRLTYSCLSQYKQTLLNTNIYYEIIEVGSVYSPRIMTIQTSRCTSASVVTVPSAPFTVRLRVIRSLGHLYYCHALTYTAYVCCVCCVGVPYSMYTRKIGISLPRVLLR